jgi:hypothetical protein
MKNITLALLITLLFMPWAHATETEDVYLDNFDYYPVGQQITGEWLFWSYVNCAVDNGLISNTQSVSTPNSLHLESADTESGMAEYRIYRKDTLGIDQGSISVKFYLDGSEDSNWLFYNHIAKDASAQELFILQLRISPTAGILAYPEAYSDTQFWFAEGADVTVDEWHELKINFDHPAQTYDILYDGDTLTSGMSFQAGDAGCMTYGCQIGDGAATADYDLNAYIDDLLILSPGVFPLVLPPLEVLREDDMETYTVGEYLPSNITGDTSTYWGYTHVFEGDENKGVISNANSFSPSQSLFWDIQGLDRGVLTMFAPNLMEKGVFRFRFYFDSAQRNQFLFLFQGTRDINDTSVRHRILELRLSARAGVMHIPERLTDESYWYTNSITHDVWHEFVIMFDHSQNMYSLALDGYVIAKDRLYTVLDPAVPNHTCDFRFGDGLARSLYDLLGYQDDFSYSVEASSAEPQILNVAMTVGGIELTLKDIGGSVSQRILWTDDLGVAWQEAAVVAGDAGTWVDSGDIGRTDPCDPSVNKRFYKVNLAP